MNLPAARALLAELRERGITIEAEGEDLFAEPRSLLTDELRDRVRSLRADLLLELGARQDDFTAKVLAAFDGTAVDERSSWRESAPFCETVVQPGVCYWTRVERWTTGGVQ